MGVCLTVSQQKELIKEVTTEEIYDSVKSLPKDKAPGIDGFPIEFFTKNWEIVQKEVLEAVQQFFITGNIVPAMNTTAITLVPKVSNPTKVKDYRPIACCTTLYKIISKVLTRRLKNVITKLIGGSQSAFIEGRSILDNVLFSHELFKCYGRKWISPRCVLKVDLRKAYDSLEWSFLKQLMVAMGFPAKFINWIMKCVTTVTYSLLLNGGLTKPFIAKRGLRQGDPMSPYLFVLAMEYLGRELKQLSRNGDFNFHPRCRKLESIHVCFAYDLLMFCRADITSIKLLHETLMKFSRASGLQASAEKSSIYIAGVADYTKKELVDALGYKGGTMPFRYLGVPLD